MLKVDGGVVTGALAVSFFTGVAFSVVTWGIFGNFGSSRMAGPDDLIWLGDPFSCSRASFSF